MTGYEKRVEDFAYNILGRTGKSGVVIVGDSDVIREVYNSNPRDYPRSAKLRMMIQVCGAVIKLGVPMWPASAAGKKLRRLAVSAEEARGLLPIGHGKRIACYRAAYRTDGLELAEWNVFKARCGAGKIVCSVEQLMVVGQAGRLGLEAQRIAEKLMSGSIGLAAAEFMAVESPVEEEAR